MRTLLLVGFALALGVASLELVPSNEQPVTLSKCLRDFAAGVKSGMPDQLGRHVPDRRIERTARAVCPELMRPKNVRALEEDDSPETYVRLIRQQPKLFVPICRLAMDADLAVNARIYRFATDAEQARYRNQHCRLAPQYLTTGPAEADLARMAADHPALYAPLCASFVQHGAGPGALPRRQLQRVARRACLEALRSGAITCGANGFSDGDLDEDRFQAILQRATDKVVAS